jgi:regulator of replication initiation timing
MTLSDEVLEMMDEDAKERIDEPTLREKLFLECASCDTDWLLSDGSRCPLCDDFLRPRAQSTVEEMITTGELVLEGEPIPTINDIVAENARLKAENERLEKQLAACVKFKTVAHEIDRYGGPGQFAIFDVAKGEYIGIVDGNNNWKATVYDSFPEAFQALAQMEEVGK